MATELRVAVRNESGFQGTALTPFFTGFHDGSFDIYNLGEAASVGLERLAEDGNNAVIAEELTAADADAQSTNVAAARGPIAAGELGTSIIEVDGASNGFVSLASMLLPSNDAFVGTADAVQLFDADGNFQGATTLSFSGADVRDAGTEVNTELDAAFINQTGPDTGVDENGVVTIHPGFNGSAGNPDGDQIILGGTNAFGDFIDPNAADFTLAGNDIATVHINVVERFTGTDGRDIYWGGSADDIVDGGGGRDILFGGSGWDEISGGDGRDIISGGSGSDVLNGDGGNDRLHGGTGNDDVNGGEGRDVLFGGKGNDNVNGGDGNDFIRAGQGDDVISGGAGRDKVHGGAGDDVFIYRDGDGRDFVLDFDRYGDDRIALDVDGVETFDDVLAAASGRGSVRLDFGDGDSLFLLGTSRADLSAEDFIFL